MMTICTIILLTMLILLSPGFAESYEQYKMPAHLENAAVFSFDNGDAFSFQSSEKVLLWEKDGQTIAVLSQDNYELLNRYVRVIQLEDGQYGILMQDDVLKYDILNRDDTLNEPYRIEYWIWSEHSMEKIRAWESASWHLTYCDKGFLLFDKDSIPILYDCYAHELWRGDTSEEKDCRPYFLRMRSTEDWLISFAFGEKVRHYACIRALHGKTVWRRQFESYEACFMRFLPLADGWTLVTRSRNDGKYGPIEISVLDSEGNTVIAREISSNRKLLSRTLLQLEADDGKVLIYGSSVSVRQGIYIVWRLHYDPQSGACLWDIRNSEYHNDYDPPLSIGNTQQTHEAPVFVKLCAKDGSGAPTILIPFEKLPPVTEQLLTVSRH